MNKKKLFIIILVGISSLITFTSCENGLGEQTYTVLYHVWGTVNMDIEYQAGSTAVKTVEDEDMLWEYQWTATEDDWIWLHGSNMQNYLEQTISLRILIDGTEVEYETMSNNSGVFVEIPAKRVREYLAEIGDES